jgi:hypothetical protein
MMDGDDKLRAAKKINVPRRYRILVTDVQQTH